ncbi:MAG TPA: DnaJ domain-containing protein [Verrucomicrobiae bacterium]
MAIDYYVALRVERNASAEQIQAAYKYWAKELQPAEDSAATEELRQLQEAFSVLGHPDRRRAYDAAKRAEPLRAPPAGAAGAGSRREINLRESFQKFHPSFDELFDRFWSNFDLMTRPKAEGLESLTIDVPVSAEEARKGGSARILIPARAECPGCFGHGAVGYYQCWRCGGQGSITADYPVDLAYPAGMINEYTRRLPLDQFGIRNFYLTVRFRVSAAEDAPVGESP